MLARDGDDADHFVRMLPRLPPNEHKVTEWFNAELISGQPLALPALVGLLDNCSWAFPKVVTSASATLSICMARKPLDSMLCLDKDMLIPALSSYLEHVFDTIKGCECFVEFHIGVLSFLDILPVMFRMANNNEKIKRETITEFDNMMAAFVSLLINLCHEVPVESDDERLSDDGPRLLEEFPELSNHHTVITDILRLGQADSWKHELLRKHPHTFAVAAGLEVLGYWVYLGIDLSQSRIPTDREPVTIRQAIEEYEEHIFSLASRHHPRLLHMKDVALAIIQGREPPNPKSAKDALLGWAMAKASMRCGLPSCRARPTDGETFQLCSGCRLEYYCCHDHQKRHWKKHKFPCQRNKPDHGQYTSS